MTLWSAKDAATATGGRATGDWQANGVSIDTRTIAKGDLFVALKDIRDGHEFVAQALEKGAAAALVSHIPKGVPDTAPLLIVDDVLDALNALGRAGRARTKARVIAITGSVGKTSTKEMLRTVLTRQGRVHAAEASYNNHWGVPLTLARLPIDSDFAVIEIGMSNPGEIAPLARLAQPEIAMITTIAPAHLEAFDDLAGIAHEKSAIFEGLLPGGTAIINGDLETTALMTAAAHKVGANVRTFGETNGNDYRLTSVKLARNLTICQARIDDTDVLFKLATPGRHFALNAVGVLGIIDALDADLALAAQDLMLWQPPQGRGTLERLALDPADPRLSIDLIDDAFNANPTSMAAALEVLAATTPIDGIGRIGKGRRIAILGDMLELGPDSAQIHANLATLPSMQSVDLVHCAGPAMRRLFDALPEDKQGHWVNTAADLAARAHTLIDAGDVVLVKGSKGSKVSHVVDAIRNLGHPLAPQTKDLI